MDGIELRNVRRDLRMTQAELAQRLGLTRESISKYESEKSPTPKYIQLALKEVQREEGRS
jgi:transcriptional regulator with XRE-family HTH domain